MAGRNHGSPHPHTRQGERHETRTLSLTITAATAMLIFAAATPALAESYEQVIDRPQDRLEDRIDQGIMSGELNRREVSRLERGQARVARWPTAPSAGANSAGSSRPRTRRAGTSIARSTTGSTAPPGRRGIGPAAPARLQVFAILDRTGRGQYSGRCGGAVAQLGEHKAGSLGVRGSSPLSSTILRNEGRGRRYQRRTACRVVFSTLIP
jgi:hypothetical protein